MEPSQTPSGLKGRLAFCCLCLLGATRWLVPDLGSPIAAEPSVLLVGAFLAASLAWGRVARKRRPKLGSLLRGAGGGALLLLGLELPLLLRAPGATSSDETIALALCPVVIAVAASAFRREAPQNLTKQLWPGLTAAAGLLLLLPQPSIRSVTAGVALCGAPLLIGIGAVLVSEEDCASAWIRAAGVSGALCSACAAWAIQQGMRPASLAWTWTAARASGVEAASLLLLFTALLSLGARRWSALFALVPLLLALEGVVLMRPQLGARPLLGMGLLVLASVFLLLPSDSKGKRETGLFGQVE